MDSIKIGKFIIEKRKAKNLTQLQLAERLYVTNRAVSKWESGRSLPDSSIMLELCEVLGISVNRSRLMKCPHCGKRTYQKKVVSKKD